MYKENGMVPGGNHPIFFKAGGVTGNRTFFCEAGGVTGNRPLFYKGAVFYIGAA